MEVGRTATGLRLALSLVLLSAMLVGGVGSASGAGLTPGSGLAQQSFDADGVSMHAAVHPNGTAVWSVQYRVELTSQNESEAFDSLRRDVEQNPDAYVERFASRIRSTARSAENATGREMTVEDVRVSTSRQQFGSGYGYGFVTYRFRWTNFVAVDGDRMEVGDALAGFYLDSDTSLSFSWPSGYRVDDVSPEPTARHEQSVVWEGRLVFGPREPRLVLAPSGGGVPTVAVGAAVVVALVALGAAGYLWRRRRGTPGGTAPAPGGESEGDATAGGETAGGETAGDRGEAAGEPASAAAGGAEEPPEELLSNEERVLRLLERHGGRVKQQVVVDELDWTAAKTSQVVTGMREEGTIEVFRLGRENVLRLPDEDETDEEDGESSA